MGALSDGKALALAVSLTLASASASASNESAAWTLRSAEFSPTVIIGGDNLKAQSDVIIGGDDKKRPNVIIGGDNLKAQSDVIIGGDASRTVASGVLVSGPVEAVDIASGKIRVVGQLFSTPAGDRVLKELQDILASGTTVTATAYGTVSSSDKPRAKAMVFSVQQHVPGVTTVFVVGTVHNVDNLKARFAVGGLTVDFSAILAAGSMVLNERSIVAVAGVRSSPEAPLVATSLHTL